MSSPENTEPLRIEIAELRRQVEILSEALEAATEELEAFTYSVSHDLRAPLRAINSLSYFLIEDYGESLSAEVVDALNRQAASAQKMGALIDELLALSRLSRQEVDMMEMDLSRIVRSIAEDLEPKAVPQGVRFEVEDGVRGVGDLRLMRLALGHLLTNAVKFSPKGGTVAFGRRGDGTYYIADEGIGFDQAYAEKLFLPFERLVRDDEFPGTGIGLAQVKKAIDRHRGRTWAEGRPGAGATFFFTLGAV